MTTQTAGPLPALAPAPADRPAVHADVEMSRLDHLLDALAEVQAAIGTLEGRRAVLLAEAAQLAERAEARLVDDGGTAARATSSRRQELARRAVVAEVATVLHVGEHAAGTLCDHADALRAKAPRTLALLSAGRCSWAHAARVARHVADLDEGDARRVEESVAPVLTTSTPGQVDARARRARENVHPEPVEVRHARAVEARGVYLDDGRDGMAWLSAHLPAVVAHAAYDRLTSTATGLRDQNGSLGRSQGMADALAALLLDDGTLDRTCMPTSARPALNVPDVTEPPGPAPSSTIPALAALARSIRPRVTVTVPVLTLLGAADVPGELDGYGPVGPEAARELAELAPSLRRVLTHPETGVPLSVGRESYTVPSALRAALARRDETCRFPGCGVAAHRADLDHTTDWAAGGTTSADNLAHLCRRHHVLKHQTGWSVRRVAPDEAGGDGATGDRPGLGGTLEWTSPTGRRHVTRPDGRPPASIHRSVPEPPVPPGLEPPAPPDVEPLTSPGPQRLASPGPEPPAPPDVEPLTSPDPEASALPGATPPPHGFGEPPF
ncbi:HNH endonuclease [Isoptericola sp. S6320L]|uniref:HNH endonuclease signature motif containing protein n=1 Tax=Isoptericola sp. S6320L TaxID=2926411 RepID=UPI001FF588C2|nr:HNH endonuclease signature motif containing protein [Isoptericola sp. S6320L]MCK0118145.1 HNH endonuclease [Isoptericola sp. S6320L]